MADDMKFLSPEQAPEGIDRELLTILSEESVEVLEECDGLSKSLFRLSGRCSKALRFGLHEVQPGQPKTNVERIEVELGDLLAVMDLCVKRGWLDAEGIAVARTAKHKKLNRFMQSQ